MRGLALVSKVHDVNPRWLLCDKGEYKTKYMLDDSTLGSSDFHVKMFESALGPGTYAEMLIKKDSSKVELIV